MATIGEEVEGNIVSTNVVDNTDVFDNTIKQNYPSGTKYKEGDSIYQNTGDDLIVTTYDAQATYLVGDLVFKDSLVQRVAATTGEFPIQPEQYASVDTSFDATLWQNRYMKLTDLPVGAKQNENTIDIQGYSNIVDLAFSSDGVWLYTLDNSDNKIYQYSLSTAWDISTAIYTNKSVTIAESNAFGLAVSADGSKIYYTYRPASFDADIISLTMTTPYDISTAGSKVIADLSIGVQIETYAIAFKPDGTKLYATDGLNDRIHEYNLSTPWNISTLSRVQYISDPTTAVLGIAFSPDGTKVYTSESWDNRIYKMNLSTPWNISTAVYTAGDYIYTGDGYVDGLAISPNGDAFYFVDRIYDTVTQFISYDPFNIKAFQKTMFPVNLNRTVEFKDYKYSVLKNGETYTFQRTDIWNANAVSEFTPMNVYATIDNSSVEELAYSNGSEKGQWLAKTLIIRDSALYIRTSVNIAVEYVTLTDYQFSIIAQASSLPNFARIGASNPYRPFDGMNITPAIHDGAISDMQYVLEGLEVFNSFTLAKVLASSLTYTFTLPVGDAEYDLWLDGISVASGGNGVVKTKTVNIDCSRDSARILSDYPTTVVYYADRQMPVGSTVSISLAYGSTIKLGDFTLNNAVSDGLTNLVFSNGIQDYNDYVPDAWGSIPEGTKAVVTKFTITMDVDITDYDRMVSLHESLVRNFVTVDGSDSKNATDNSQVFNSLTRRVLLTNVSSKTVEKKGELERMGVITLSAREIV